MSAEFGELFEPFASVVSWDYDAVFKKNKTDLSNLLLQAFEALKCADKTIRVQADTIMKTTRELVHQCEVSRNSLNSVSEAGPSRSFSEVVRKKPPVIILKPTDPENQPDVQRVNQSLKKALEKIPVNRTHVSDNGTVVVDLPSTQSRELAVKNLTSALSNQFTFHEPERKIHRILVTNVSNDITDESLVPIIRKKESFVSDCVNNGDLFQVERSWIQAHVPERTARKHFVIKCSVKLRNHLMRANNGYVYVELERYRVQDYVNPLQCFHCCRFESHVAANCPDKNKPSVCGICMGSHDTKKCNLRREGVGKCCNCARNNLSDTAHNAFSKQCPSFLSARDRLLKKLDFSEETSPVREPNPKQSNSSKAAKNS